MLDRDAGRAHNVSHIVCRSPQRRSTSGSFWRFFRLEILQWNALNLRTAIWISIWTLNSIGIQSATATSALWITLNDAKALDCGARNRGPGIEKHWNQKREPSNLRKQLMKNKLTKHGNHRARSSGLPFSRIGSAIRFDIYCELIAAVEQ